MSSATYQEIQELIGDVDELLVERLVMTGASRDEINEALCSLQDEQRFGDPHPATSPRVTEARVILEELLDDPEEVFDGRIDAAQSA